MLSERGNIVKKQLEELNQQKRRIRNLRNEMQELLELGALPQRSDCKLPSGKGGTVTSPQERYLLKIESLEEKISKAIDTALEIEDRFLESMDKLDVLSQNLLMERYLTGKPLKKIIRDFNYSERNIFKLYNKAFEQLAEKKEKKSKECSKVQ